MAIVQRGTSLIMISKKQENEMMWEQFVMESPWLTQALPDKFDEDMSNLNVDKIKGYKHIDNYKDYSIYENITGEQIELFVSQNDLFVVYYRYHLNENGGIQTKLTWNNKNNKGSFLDIFSNYIIPKFKVVESDNMMTSKAFDMWKSLILLKPDYNFYVKNGNKISKLESPYDVYLYKERMGITNDENSTFIVSI